MLSLTRSVLVDTTPHAADARMARVRAKGEEWRVINDEQRVAKVSMNGGEWKGTGGGRSDSLESLRREDSVAVAAFGRASKSARDTNTAVVDWMLSP